MRSTLPFNETRHHNNFTCWQVRNKAANTKTPAITWAALVCRKIGDVGTAEAGPWPGTPGGVAVLPSIAAVEAFKALITVLTVEDRLELDMLDGVELDMTQNVSSLHQIAAKLLMLLSTAGLD